MSTASILENVNPRSTVDQFDKEFRRYTSVQVRPSTPTSGLVLPRAQVSY